MTELDRVNVLVAKAQLILEYLKVTSFTPESGLVSEETSARRERVESLFEVILDDLAL